ncbi:hypothetical protein C8Q70DRAFT_1051258 [Cubamyces menziesii]|nr:hypothetical protein C8Q70DRAFT_1051258 [Cubamyces menziesii]
MLPDQPKLIRRDSDSGGGKLSTSTIIIIAVVCGCVVLLVFVLFLWRNLARSCRRSRKVPLPPVQDLAHHREQHHAASAAAVSRPATWVDPQLFHHPRGYSSHFLSATASNASLIRSSPDLASTSPTRENSWAVDDATVATSAESSPYPTPLSTDDLRAPNPSYFATANPHNSMASVVSDASDSSALAASPSELAASVESSTSLMHQQSGSASSHVPSVRPRPPRASRSRSRPLSVVSYAGTMQSLQTSHSINTLRGPAHSIHSNIQIVLPAPLAPELYPAVRPTDERISMFGGGGGGGSVSRANSFYGGGEGDRRSVADPWLSGAVGQPNRASARMEREGSGSGSSSRRSSVGPRPASASAARTRSSLSKMASASSLSDSASTKAARRAQSQPPAAPYPPPPPPHPLSQPGSRATSPGPTRPPSAPPVPVPVSMQQGGAPPVPRIPSMYGSSGVAYPISEEQHELDERYARGRPARKPAPAPVPPTAQPYSYSSSPVPQPAMQTQTQTHLPQGAAMPVRDPLMQYTYTHTDGSQWAVQGPTDRPPPVNVNVPLPSSPEPRQRQRYEAQSPSPTSPRSSGPVQGQGQGRAQRQPSKLRKQQRS